MRDIRTIDLNLLRTLDALLDEGSVTRAAERLNLTQPAVSGMLTRLRESFDDPLFVRTRHGILPTLRASEIAGPLKHILGEVELLFQPSAFDPSTADFTISLAATDYALHAVVVPFLSKLRRLAPRVRVVVRSIEDDRLQARFERGEIDLALLALEATLPDLHVRRLFGETYVCAMRDDHPDAVNGALSIERFFALDHAVVSHTGKRYWGVADDALATAGYQRRTAVCVTSFPALAEILRSTDLIAVVPLRLAKAADGLVLIEPPINIPGFTKLALWHERTNRDPGHEWARDLLFATCGAVDASPGQMLRCPHDHLTPP